MPRPVWLRIELPKLCAGRYGDALAVLAGAASVAAFAPFGLWPLAPLALATLTWLCLDLAPRRAFWRGFWFGVGQFAFGIHWIYFSVRDIGQAPLPLAVGLLAALVVAMALFPALCMALARQRRWPVDGARFALLVLPAAWTFIEWTRGWFLGGFPWLALGYAHLDTPLAGYAPLLGVYGVSWAVALTAGGLLLIARSGTRARVLAATVLLVVWGGGWWANGVRWTHPAGPPIEVALVQGNIRQELKWLPEQFRPTLERYFNLSAAHLDADLIVWPEAAVPALYHWVADTVIAEADALRRAGDADLLFGVLHHEPEGDRYYNAVLGLGDTRAFYFKRHLVPFGEFFPVPAVVREW
ncbi:MAG TPA: apolipoprotein N-acyltransferase, partial [Gammaproteobacteria bacterium]|nr:apolipoprotein N-acyltransferase [Gammaproteobacteria bacterium]